VAILAVAIAHSKVPKILDLGEIFDYEEVILIRLRHTISCLAWARQVCELCNMVLDFADRLLGWRGIRLLLRAGGGAS